MDIKETLQAQQIEYTGGLAAVKVAVGQSVSCQTVVPAAAKGGGRHIHDPLSLDLAHAPGVLVDLTTLLF